MDSGKPNWTAVVDRIKRQLLPSEVAYGEILYKNGDCQLLSQSPSTIEFLLYIPEKRIHADYSLLLVEDDNGKLINILPQVDGERAGWNRYAYACLLQYENELQLLNPKEKIEHKQYTRTGMIKRVLAERLQKANKANYRMQWANNIYGDHILINEKGVKYKIFLRNFENETGYSNSPDSRFNKLGTTKHIMFAFQALKNNVSLYQQLDKTFPFIEIFCDPLNDNKITWYYPYPLSSEEQSLITRHFKESTWIEDAETESFLRFIEEASGNEHICIRPEVRDKVGRAFEQSMLLDLSQSYQPDYSVLKMELFPYQKEGVEFALFRKAAIIADEMGLGKTLQAIAAAVLKKELFGFYRTLVVCPATLKSQWKKEIEKFTDEKALVVNGTPEEREIQYKDTDYSFFIVNYETVLRDSQAINKAGIDFLILDEAQKIKNFETQTSSAIRRLHPKHILIITGTPIENRLIDIYSLVSAIDPYFLGPLWEFSYQHCLFDPERQDKINGYYNLQSLNERLSNILIRREKRNVLSQLPNVQQTDIPVELSPLQMEYHGSYAKGIASILRKKFLTPYDLQKLQLLLSNMRMVCDSTYLIDETTNESPKLEELKDILFNQLNLKNTDRKIIIFSEWIKVHKLIGQVLRENQIGFVELNGNIPIKSRGDLIKKFENNPECKIFLSTEAGGAGLNLQVADMLINFELPWNPAKKNQRIGRIDRLGQKSHKLTVYNLIARNSIEQQIAAGLLLKQNLFEGVLDNDCETNYVDFSAKGRSQFIEQLSAFIASQEVEQEADPELDELANEEDLVENEEANVTEQHESVAEQKPTVEMEQVLNNGMQFLSGLFKMATGKDLNMDNNQIVVNKETGEVTMTFKMPKMV